MPHVTGGTVLWTRPDDDRTGGARWQQPRLERPMTEDQRTLVVRSSQVCHGQATVRGTRILVSIVLDALADGMTEAEILARAVAVPKMVPSRASVAVVRALPGSHAANTLTELATVHDRVLRRHVGDVLPEGRALTRADVRGESGRGSTYRQGHDEQCAWQRSAENHDREPPWDGASLADATSAATRVEGPDT
jgi:hypothetical protein